MQPDNDSLEQRPDASLYDSSLESDAPHLTPLSGPPGVSSIAQRRHRRRIILLELLIAAIIAGVGIAALLLTSPNSTKTDQSNGNKASNYSVKNVPLQGVNGDAQL